MKLAAEEKKTVIENVPADLSHQVDTDETLHTKLGWWIVLAGFGGFILWASFAPLDKGVPVPGTVTVASHLQAVQHQIGGIIDSILVKEGEHVAVGQVLVRMNDVQLKAQAEITRSQLYTARAMEARLLAERDGSKEITFPQDLLTSQHDPRIANNIITQNQLFTSRQLALHHEIAALEENIAGSRMQLRGLEASRASKNAQLKFLEEQLVNLRDLAQDGFVPRNRVLELERTYTQLTGEISAETGNIGRIQRQIAELEQRRIHRQQEYQKEVRQQ
ncbi:MAG: biotin/lipoyl-binding protein, partial [Nitrosomonas sp.]|nr:biotin/lipoyl-binding protein [Nitrosomonas sp.]